MAVARVRVEASRVVVEMVVAARGRVAVGSRAVSLRDIYMRVPPREAWVEVATTEAYSVSVRVAAG